MSAVAKPSTDLRTSLKRFEPSLANLLPPGYAVSRLTTGALVAVQRNPALARCTPISIATALAQVAQWGLDVGVTAHLVPYGADCTAIADYKGYIELILESRLVAAVHSGAVHEGDEWYYELGLDQKLRHIPKGGRKDRPVTHAYCIIRLKSGMDILEVMAAEDIDAIRQKHSKSWKQGPLPAWYARKTVIRQAAKMAPKSNRLSRLMADDDETVVQEASPELLQAFAQAEAPTRRPAVPVRVDGVFDADDRPDNVTEDGEVVE
jgi:recombination protein RecT